MKRIGVYGGTFNPIHLGHIQFVLQMTASLRLDEVYIVPAKLPPHKQYHQIVSAEHRSEMCTLAFRKQPKVRISDIEINREGISYTIDTLKEIKLITGVEKLYFLVGEDAFCSLDRWYGFKDMLPDAVFCTAYDNPFSEKIVSEKAKAYLNLGATIATFSMPLRDISSTNVRKHISMAQILNTELPTDVITYISKNKLYI